jgi:hypothetical protein
MVQKTSISLEENLAKSPQLKTLASQSILQSVPDTCQSCAHSAGDRNRASSKC